MSNEFKYKVNIPEREEFTSKIRVVNSKYNSLGVTIPKQVVEKIGLKKDDLMTFRLGKESGEIVSLYMFFSRKK